MILEALVYIGLKFCSDQIPWKPWDKDQKILCENYNSFLVGFFNFFRTFFCYFSIIVLDIFTCYK